MIEEKEISLSSIIKVIWERGKRILLFSLICMIFSAAVSLRITDRYESSAVLMMNKSKIGERAMTNPAIPMQTYEELFFPKADLIGVIKEFALDGEPYYLKYAESLGGRVKVTYVEETSLIDISVQLENPEMAAKVANALASRAIETSNKLVQMEQVSSTQKMEEQSKIIYDQTQAFKDVYLKSMQKNLIQQKVQDLNNYMSMFANAMQQKENLDASIVELQMREEKFREIFSATSDYKQKLEVRRALITDPILVDRIRENKGGDVTLDDLKDLAFIEETIDANYNMLLAEYKKLLVDLPAMIAKRDHLAKREVELKEKCDDLQKEVNDMNVEELITKGDFDRAMEVYAGIYKEVGWAGTTVAAERQDLVPVYDAVPDPKKVYPRRSLMVALTGMTAFLLSFLYYLLIDLYGLVKLQTRREETEA